MPQQQQKDGEFIELEFEDSEPDPERRLIINDCLNKQRLIFQDCLNKLPEEKKMVVTLSLEGLSYSEVAQRLGKPEATVRQIRKRGLDKLREYLYK